MLAVANMQAVGSLFSVMRGRGPLAPVPVPTWLGGSSWRGSLRRQRRVLHCFVHRGEGGRRRALHDPISLLIVAPQIFRFFLSQGPSPIKSLQLPSGEALTIANPNIMGHTDNN